MVLLKLWFFILLLLVKVIHSIKFNGFASSFGVNHLQLNEDLSSKTFKIKKGFDFRLAFAGGLAGGVTNAILYPMDTMKTMRQSDPNINNMLDALKKLQKTGIMKAYSGILPAVIGAIPSSALYFGTYEFSKGIFTSINVSRPLIHMISAATGNIMSSLIFVPKEMIKLKMQAITTGSIPVTLNGMTVAETSGIALADTAAAEAGKLGMVVREIYRTGGVQGFYPSFRATLARNIPSAVIRFTVYEELKYSMMKLHLLKLQSGSSSSSSSGSSSSSSSRVITIPLPNLTKYNIDNNININLDAIFYLIAGATASAFASAACTPLDVVKTRISTGRIAAGTPLIQCLRDIARDEGVHNLYAGVNSRLLGSALFGGIGFTSFEFFKQALHVNDDDDDSNSISKSSSSNSNVYSKKNQKKKGIANRR